MLHYFLEMDNETRDHLYEKVNKLLKDPDNYSTNSRASLHQVKELREIIPSFVCVANLDKMKSLCSDLSYLQNELDYVNKVRSLLKDKSCDEIIIQTENRPLNVDISDIESTITQITFAMKTINDEMLKLVAEDHCLKLGFTVEGAEKRLKSLISCLPRSKGIGKGKLFIKSSKTCSLVKIDDIVLIGIKDELIKADYLAELVILARIFRLEVYCQVY